LNQKNKILLLLSDGEWHLNVELNKICFRYGARITELRQGGNDIEAERVKRGLFRYRWNDVK
jgi:hypothetical protein